MELGVDIAQLNLVSLRNVPPTPANYAQRSVAPAAAGSRRWCSPIALVSPHDQYFYRAPSRMVSGSVAPLASTCATAIWSVYIHAVWMEAAKARSRKT